MHFPSFRAIRSRRAVGSVPLFVLLAILSASPATAQNAGAITGTVRDPQGLALPGVTVTVANRVSAASETMVTDAAGAFTAGNLGFGTYVVTATLEGFSTITRVVEIRSSVPMPLSIELGLAGLEESVTVSADALLETRSTGSHIDLSGTLISQLPTSTPSKQLSAILLSAPGFIPSQNGRVHVRGSHGQIQYVVDGVPMTDEYTEAFSNPLDVQYVKAAQVMTGGIPAEYGGKLAAVVDVTSKSGLDQDKPVFGNVSFNAGRFAALDGTATAGGRIASHVGYFVTVGANRTDRYLNPPTMANLHNSGNASRFIGKLEFRPGDRDFFRVTASVNASRFDIPNRAADQANGVKAFQRLQDNAQTVSWLRQLGDRASLSALAYRRAATARLDALTGFPIAASQHRSLDHQGLDASYSYSTPGHQLKAGVQYDRNPVDEHFSFTSQETTNPLLVPYDPGLGGVPFVFNGRRAGHTLGLYVQEGYTPIPDLHLTAGLRYDRYHLLVDDTAWSPRVGLAYHVHRTETVLRASYNRLFMPPFAENLLLSSSAEAQALSPRAGEGLLPGAQVRPERDDSWELGLQQALGSDWRIDLAYYRKSMRNAADVDQFLDTTVTFPVSVARGLAQGVEMRLDLPTFHHVNGYLSLARATILMTAPITGGLFLETDLPAPGDRFYADHDQRWQSQFGITYTDPDARYFASVTGRYDSGIPFEVPAGFDPATYPDQQALPLVNLSTGRAKARAIFNLLGGVQLFQRGDTRVSLDVGALNVFNRTYLLNFLSIFNGTHYGTPRVLTTQLKVAF